MSWSTGLRSRLSTRAGSSSSASSASAAASSPLARAGSIPKKKSEKYWTFLKVKGKGQVRSASSSSPTPARLRRFLRGARPDFVHIPLFLSGVLLFYIDAAAGRGSSSSTLPFAPFPPAGRRAPSSAAGVGRAAVSITRWVTPRVRVHSYGQFSAPKRHPGASAAPQAIEISPLSNGREWSFGYAREGSGVYAENARENPLHAFRETVRLPAASGPQQSRQIERGLGRSFSRIPK